MRLVTRRLRLPVIRRALGSAPLLAATLLVGACDRGPRLSKERSAVVIQSSAFFTSRKFAGVPRVLSVNTGGTVVFDTRVNSTPGEMFGLEQLAKVDPVIAVLRARGRVDVEEFVSAVPVERAPPEPPALNPTPPLPATMGTGTGTPAGTTPGGATATTPAAVQQATTPPAPTIPIGSKGWIHTFRVTPTARLDASALVVDDGEDDESAEAEPIVRSFGPAVSRTPGWKLAIGTREFIKVLDVFNAKNKNVEIGPGEIAVDFEWRWRPSNAGDVFDTGSSEFQSLPEALRQALKAGGVSLETGNPLWSRAVLRHTSTGWTVKAIDWTFGLNHQRES